MSRADYLRLGDWNAACSMCGRKRKASELVRNWQGMYRCREHNEARHPQDFVRGVRENMAPPFVQPQTDVYVLVCSINGRSGIPGRSMPGCMMPGNNVWSSDEDPVVVPPLCDIFSIQAVPGTAGPGCAMPGEDFIAA